LLYLKASRSAIFENQVMMPVMHTRNNEVDMAHIDVNQVKLFYQDYGDGPETMVFSHGLLMDSSMWDLVVPAFKNHYRIICFDHRGQGQSQDPGCGYHIDQLAEDAAALIATLCKTPVHYVGLSMGGMVGMRVAARYPALLRSIVLLDTSAQAEPWYEKIKYRLMSAMVKCFGVGPVIPSTMKLMFGRSTLKNPEKIEMLQQWRQKLNALNKNILGPVMGVMLRRDGSRELGAIRCPALIVVGDEDRTTPLHCAYHLNAHITDAELAVIEHCGHSSALEKPEQVIELMQHFYSRLP
jgi:3-oxoadipate enol-lactonase